MPVPIAGTNCLTKAEDALVMMLSTSQRFQLWCGAIDSSEALARIYTDQLPGPANRATYTAAELDNLFPCVAVFTDPDDGFTRVRSTDTCFKSTQGSLIAVWHQFVLATDDEHRADRRLKNAAWDTVEEIEGSIMVPGNLLFNSVTYRGTHRFEHDMDQSLGGIIYTMMQIIWGYEES